MEREIAAVIAATRPVLSPSWWRTWAEYRTETFKFSRIDYAIRRIRIGDTVKTLGARRQCASPPGHCAMVACATAGGACLRATCRAVKAKHGRDERGKRRGGAAARACTCVRCGRGGGSPAVCAERLYTPLVMRGGRGAHRTQPPSGARGSARAAVRAAGEGGGDDDVGRRSGIRIAGDSGGDDRHWEAAEGESTRRTRADFAGSQAMVGAAHRIAGSERTGGGGERWRQRKAAAQQIPVLRRSHAESRMGSIQHAVGTRGPGSSRRHGPSFSCLGQNDLPFRTWAEML